MPEARGAIGDVMGNSTLTGISISNARSRVLCAAARLDVADAFGGHERTVNQLASLCQPTLPRFTACCALWRVSASWRKPDRRASF
jgi:hypothetical protein